MSDYIFHPRFQMRNSDWLKVYYSDPMNPWYNAQPGTIQAEDRYTWGRFWEIIDWYIQQPQNTRPYELGYVKRTRTQGGIVDYAFMDECAYWGDAATFDSAYITFENVDSYGRAVVPLLGAVALFYHDEPTDPANYFSGIIEWIDPQNSGHFKISRWNYRDAFFESVNVLNDQCIIQGENCFSGGTWVASPIDDMYDSVIQGKRLYWKPWLYYIKRKLMMQRGDIL